MAGDNGVFPELSEPMHISPDMDPNEGIPTNHEELNNALKQFMELKQKFEQC